MSTKKELEQELHKVRQEKLEVMGKYANTLDRKKLAGHYLQCLRLLPQYTGGSFGLTVLNECDYDRILAILEVDSFPEGF